MSNSDQKNTIVSGVNADLPLEFVGQVLDNVHGFISYTEAERDIMNTRLFKRLQSIKQLSVVNWVFPGSEHTRYIHSLGVMHVADKMAIALKLTNRERRILRLAGLLHDIGHYPMSHVGEYPYHRPEALNTMDDAAFCKAVNNSVIQRIEGFSIKGKTQLMKKRTGWHHEAVGGLIVKNNSDIRGIVEKELGTGAADIIADIIIGRVEREETDPLWVQIMHSELDADGIDYMMRDSAFAGTNFGAGEIDQLIRCLVKADYNGKRIMCIRPKAIPAADQYLLNKFFHYSQVVFNRHIVVSEWMAEQVINWMRQHSAIFPSRKTLKAWADAGGGEDYLAFTDNLFWAALDKILNDDLKELVPSHIRLFCECLLHHDEPVAAKRHEIRITSNVQQDIIDRLMQSEIYTKPERRAEWITTLSERTMTNQMKLQDFEDAVNAELDENHADEEERKAEMLRLKTSRLMECICVRDYDGDLHLLCDDERSLMQTLHNQTLVVLRSYIFPTK